MAEPHEQLTKAAAQAEQALQWERVRKRISEDGLQSDPESR
jgi:hypothetical protein